MRARAFNSQVFLEFVCYSGFAGLMLYLVGSRKYISYVTPRMEPYLYFAAIVMGVWALAGLLRMFRPQHKVRAAHCFVLVIPILLLLLPHSPLSTSDLSGAYIGGNTLTGQSGQGPYGTPQKQAPSSNSDVPASTTTGDPLESEAAPAGDSSATAQPEDSDAAGLHGLDVANKKITVSNDDFGMWLSEFYANPEQYKGYTVVMTGFVFKDSDTFREDEFVPARLMMSCCVADLAPTGLLCKYDKTPELKAESWVTVEGTFFIGKLEYDGVEYDDPQLTVTKITPAEAVEGYVYLY